MVLYPTTRGKMITICILMHIILSYSIANYLYRFWRSALTCNSSGSSSSSRRCTFGFFWPGRTRINCWGFGCNGVFCCLPLSKWGACPHCWSEYVYSVVRMLELRPLPRGSSSCILPVQRRWEGKRVEINPCESSQRASFFTRVPFHRV